MTRLQLIGRSLGSIISELESGTPLTRRALVSKMRQVRYWVREHERERLRSELSSSTMPSIEAALAALEPLHSVGQCPACESPLECDTSNSLQAVRPAGATATSNLPPPAPASQTRVQERSLSSAVPKDPLRRSGSWATDSNWPSSSASSPRPLNSGLRSARIHSSQPDAVQGESGRPLDPPPYSGPLSLMPQSSLVQQALDRLTVTQQTEGPSTDIRPLDSKESL